ncbi:SDR family oxidoreductase [Proteobacteria bacterium 005FR1]|nr:SDR family oxidoreductase [Proteobacteria bacterium 005FR1]
MEGKPLAGQRALVTGASKGIGNAIACAYASAGASVVVNYRSSREEAEQMKADINKSGGEALAVKADISTIEGCEKLFRSVEQEWGGVDIVVANAGIQRDAAFMEMSAEDWHRVIDVNLTGQFICAQGAVRCFRRCKHDPEISAARGKVIFTSSVHQKIPWPGHVNYAAAKGGLKLLMETMALELAHEKIRVNAIAPGAIQTDINEDVWSDEEGRKKMLQLIPYGRIGEPEDIAKAAVWLASDESDYVVGTTLFVDGGMTLYPSFRDAG